MAVNIGPKIGIEGEAEFRESIRKINAQYKTLTAETKAVSAAFDDNDKSQERLRVQAEQLKKTIEVQQEKVRLMAEAVEKANAAWEQGDTRIMDWQQRLYAAQADLAKTERALRSTEDDLESFGEEAADAAEGVEEAAEATADFGDVLRANLLAEAVISGFRQLVDMAKEAASGVIESAASVQAADSQFEQTFGSMQREAREALRAVSEEAGIASTRMQESYTRIYAFAKTAGADSAEALNLSERAIRAAADSAAYYDRSIEDATETLQSFLKGNYENDAALGIAATETTRNAKANEMYAESFKDLSESQKVDVLLAMVEAGNEASGALGQAARESDAWENVTGELNESYRKLQATVGKPVLKNTIPLIQQLTKSLNEAADSAKFEAMSQGFANSLGWLIDNGQSVLSAAGGIAAGIATLKVAAGASEDIDKLKKTIDALRIASTAHPVALIASAISAVVAAAILAPKPVDELSQKTKELAQTSKELSDAIGAVEEEFSATERDVEHTATIADRYIDQLARLERQGLDSADAQASYNRTVAVIRELLPDVNIEIDEQTGLVKGGAKAIRDQTKAWSDLAIAEAKYKKATGIAEAIVESQEKLEQSKDLLAGYRAELQRLITAQADLFRQFEAGEIDAGIYDSRRSYMQLQIDSRRKDIDLLYEDMAKTREAISEYEGELDRYDELIGSAADSTGDLTEATEELGEAIYRVNGTDFSSMEEAYKSLRQEAQESIDRQIGLFEDLSEKSDTTFDDLLEALESQVTAFHNYADNLDKAVELGIDEGLIRQLSDGSKESMQILEVLVNGSDEEIRRLGELLGLKDDEMERIVKKMADLMKDQIETVEDAVDDMYRAGANNAQGAIDGWNSRSQEYVNAVGNTAAAAQRKFRAVNMIQSPSKWFRKNAQYVGDGAILGIKDREKEYADAIAKFSQMAQEEFEVPAIIRQGISIPYPPIDGFGGVSAGGSKTISLGGITMYVNAPNVDNVEALTDVIAEKLGARVMKEVAAYG